MKEFGSFGIQRFELRAVVLLCGAVPLWDVLRRLDQVVVQGKRVGGKERMKTCTIRVPGKGGDEAGHMQSSVR